MLINQYEGGHTNTERGYLRILKDKLTKEQTDEELITQNIKRQVNEATRQIKLSEIHKFSVDCGNFSLYLAVC